MEGKAYECTRCGRRFEIEAKGEKEAECPYCGNKVSTVQSSGQATPSSCETRGALR